LFVSQPSVYYTELYSFPTRRSSDLTICRRIAHIENLPGPETDDGNFLPAGRDHAFLHFVRNFRGAHRHGKECRSGGGAEQAGRFPPGNVGTSHRASCSGPFSPSTAPFRALNSAVTNGLC